MISNLAAMDEKSEDGELEEHRLRFIVFWEGTDSIMTLADLAVYCAPICGVSALASKIVVLWI
jgi:hypothetical protein